MLIDLLNSQNYIMVSMDAIKIFGLNTAVYCAELLNIYKKAHIKHKLIQDKYFKVDREFIAQRTSLDINEQLQCDIKLSKVNVISRCDEADPDVICLDIEVYASLLSSEDVKILEKVSKTVKTVSPSAVKQSNKQHSINTLKASIECKDVDVLFALKGWVDSLFEVDKGLSKAQIKYFKDKLDEYCNGDKAAALKIIEIATIHNYIDCQWAINTYERDIKKVDATSAKGVNFSQVTTQRTTTKISNRVF